MDQDGEPGFRQIGDLTREIVHEPGKLVSMLTKSFPSGRATGSAREVSKPTGREPSTTTSLRSLTVVEAQATSDPALVDHALLASLPPCVQSACLERWTDNTGEDRPDEIAGFAFMAVPVDPHDLITAIRNVEQGLRPCGNSVMKSELARLRAVTASRNAEEGDLTLAFAAYAEGLQEYPEDIVKHELRYWGRNEKFWPSLSELRLLCENAVKRRRSLHHALNSWKDINDASR